MYEHLKPVINKVSKLKVGKPPVPWKLVTSVSVRGLRAVGFDTDSENLLIVSSQGRGVIDCISGEKVARDEEDYYDREENLEADGIGILQGKVIRLSGLFGGGLPKYTKDRWGVESVTLEWPEESILLIEPGSDLYGSIHNIPDNMSKIESDSTIRAYGFSYSGRTLIIATSSDVTIYGRNC